MEQLSDWQFDGAVKALLQVLGVSGGIVTLVGVAFFVQSWIEGMKNIFMAGRATRRTYLRARRSLASAPAARRIALVITTVTVPLSQMLTVLLCFVCGNYLGMTIDDGRAEEVVRTLATDASPASMVQVLRVDWISGSYVLVAIAVLIRSYRAVVAAPNAYRPGPLVLVLAWPAILLMVLGLAGGALFLIIGLFGLLLTLVSDSEGVPEFLRTIGVAGLPLLGGLGVAFVYYAACRAAVNGSELLVSAWTDNNAPNA